MERLNQIFQDSYYQECLKKNEEAERTRIYCKHDLVHFLDVARLMWITVLEKRMSFKRDIIYATAFLHDIGRYRQYKDGIPHEIASAQIANELLQKYDFSEKEIICICDAITTHRGKSGETELAILLYHADKASRKCYVCEAKETCNWSMQKRNLKIEG